MEGTVIEVVKGGLIVDIGLRGFLPASLIELRRVRDLTPYLVVDEASPLLEQWMRSLPAVPADGQVRDPTPSSKVYAPRRPAARRGTRSKVSS